MRLRCGRDDRHRWQTGPIAGDHQQETEELFLHVLILGAAGMVGRKLVERLLRDGRLGKKDITRMTLHDVATPARPEKPGFPVDVHAGDFAVPGAAEKLIADRPDAIFHLAAIVSGEAELD